MIKENTVDAKAPKIKDHASPENTGSRVITQAPKIAAPAVNSIGVNLTAPESIIASLRSAPCPTLTWMKSIRIIELRTTIPAKAIMPIIAVAVKKIESE